jgi:hypothetical protein
MDDVKSEGTEVSAEACESLEMRPGCLGIVWRGRDSHQAFDAEVAERLQTLEQSGGHIDTDSALGGFAGDVDLEQAPDRPAALRADPIETERELFAVECVDQVEERHGWPGLVPLKMANEMPSRSGSVHQSLGYQGNLPGGFLDVILAEIPDPCGQRAANHCRPDGLGDRHQGHRSGIAP